MPKIEISNEFIVERLQKPVGRKIDVVLDTDTYNEIDDQYALAYILKNTEKMNLQAIYAAPFSNFKTEDPAVGMEKSYEEIFRILELVGRRDLSSVVKKGADRYLPSEDEPVVSPAAEDLVARAMARKGDEPLYVIALAAITNVASALLMEPEIARKVVVVWLGGHSFDWHDTWEFNMRQDIAGARVLFNSGVPVVQLPCKGVVSHLSTTGPELRYWLEGKNELCDYLCSITIQEANMRNMGEFWSKPIWDVSAVAWLLDYDSMYDRLEPAPLPAYDYTYSFVRTRHPIRYVYGLERDKILGDLFTKLSH